AGRGGNDRGYPTSRGLRGRAHTLRGVAEARAKIVATIGPASRSEAAIAAIARAGADVLRVNGAHEGPAGTARVVEAARRVSRRTGRGLAVLVDLPGVKRRIGALPDGHVVLARGARVVLATAGRAAGSIPIP